MDKIVLEHMTWLDVQKALDEGVDTVVVVVASTEQHGPHLPLGTDILWGKALGEKVAHRLGNALLAPVIPVGCTEALMSFPGTLTLRQETVIATIVDYCRSLARHRFKNVLLLTSHEGDFLPIEAAVQRMREMGEERPQINVIAYSDIRELVGVIFSTAAEHDIDVVSAGAHSGEFETSVMMAVHPDLVAEDKVEKGVLIDFPATPDLFAGDLREISANGIIGDPTLATREMGNAYLESLTEAIVRYAEARLVR